MIAVFAEFEKLVSEILRKEPARSRLEAESSRAFRDDGSGRLALLSREVGVEDLRRGQGQGLAAELL